MRIEFDDPITETSNQVYEYIGEKFPIRWVVGTAIINSDDLPEGIDESDVESAFDSVTFEDD